MKKELNYIIPIVAIGFIFLFFMMNVPMTGKVVEKPYFPSECSDEEIKKVWESVFHGSSDNLVIANEPSKLGYNLSQSQETTFTCPLYTAYQLNGSKLKMLYESNGWFLTHMKLITAVSGNFSQETLENLTNFNATLNPLLVLEIMGQALIDNKTINRGIGNIPQAQEHFESIFKVSSKNWEVNLTEEDDVYSFSKDEEMGNVTLFGETINPEGIVDIAGMVFQNISFDVYMFSQASIYNIAYLKTYENWTSPINTSVENITIKLNESKLNFLAEYDNVEEFEIQQNNKTIVKANINISQGIDFTNIVLKKQPSNSEVGYIIINGINETKNVTLDKLSSESESVCIKSGEINSISEMSNNCDGFDEYLLDCPGTLNNFTCEIINDTFFVTGLEHSAVLEFLPYEEVCIPNWNCGIWTDKTNNCGYRDCEDLNGCNNITTMPQEFKECPIICVPNWDCTDWEPEKCPKEEERTRTCEDLNNCGKNTGKPSNSQSCERDNKLWLWILLGIFVLLIAIILIISFRSPRRHKPIQEQTHNPHPDDEQHEHELPDETQQTYVPEKEDNDFQEFKQNKRLQENPDDKILNFEKQERSKRKGDFYLP